MIFETHHSAGCQDGQVKDEEEELGGELQAEEVAPAQGLEMRKRPFGGNIWPAKCHTVGG